MQRVRVQSKFQKAWEKYKKENPDRETKSLYVNERKTEIRFLDSGKV